MTPQTRCTRTLGLALAGCLALLAGPASAQIAPVAEHPLSAFTVVDERLAAGPDLAPLEEAESSLALEVKNGWAAFRMGGPEGEWNASIDRRTGKLESAMGHGIPWIPGRGNSLKNGDVKALGSKAKPDLDAMEKVARGFLPRVAALLGVQPSALVLNRGRSGQPADYLWYVDFDVVLGDIAVDGARVVFTVNNGNLIEIGSENLPSPGVAVPKARVSREQALAALASHIGGLAVDDLFSDPGSLHLLAAAASDARFAEGYAFGKGRELLLAWQFHFVRDGASWRARVDAATGKLIDFYSLDRYAQVTGGVMQSGAQSVLPMPFADIRQGAALLTFTNSAGLYNYPGGALTCNLNGQFVRIVDTCGTITGATDPNGNVPFGSSPANNCSTPGTGGLGNTRSSRTQFYHLNRAKETGRGWLPANAWLSAQLRANVNINSACNANWTPGTGQVNFYRSGVVGPFTCGNTGEIEGVSLHEYGHGLDQNDGNGTSLDPGTGETYGDVTAILQTHASCIGPGFFIVPPNCPSYGTPCLSCSGVRDVDWGQRAGNTPHTVGNFTQTNCPPPNPPSYVGPCGREGHCESYVSSEAIWDFVARDLPNPGTASAWAVLDRLWYLSRATANRAFFCTPSGTPWTSHGCGTGTYWRALRAVDDDDGNLANGTPHSCNLFAAFNRHGIACTTDPGANVCFSGCTPPSTPTLTTVPGDAQVQLSWTSSGAGVVYDVYRNESGCNAGFTKIANDVAGLSLTDTAVANDFTYFYQVIAHPTGNEACSTPPSACQTVTPRQRTDVWSQDLPVDTGLEPDPATAGLPMWMSQDIWVRNDATPGPHQNPEAGQVNFVHVTVRNRSTVTAHNTPVKVYFANASTGLSWPIHWTQIGTATIPTLAGGATTEIVLPWTPTVTGHFCLLSRLDTPQDPMTFTETVFIEYNVRQNNNIVWKNVNVVDLLPTPIVQVKVIFRRVRRPPPAGFVAAGAEEVEEFTQLFFREPEDQRGNPFLKRGQVRVILPEKLIARMEEQGIEPEGFERVDDRTFQVRDAEGASVAAYLKDGEEFEVELVFEDKEHKGDSTANEKDVVTYRFDLVQEQEGEVVGGVSYDIQAQKL